MQRTKSYSIKGNPIPWARAGVYQNRFYDSQKNEKLLFSISLQSQHDEEPLFDKPMALIANFYMPIPQNKKNHKNKFHSSKPDLDNLLKFLLDAIKNVIIKDDRMINSITSSKKYDPEPRTEFIIIQME